MHNARGIAGIATMDFSAYIYESIYIVLQCIYEYICYLSLPPSYTSNA